MITLLSQLLDHGVAQMPGKTAVQLDEEQISYGELHDQAHSLASFLAAHGIGPGERVGILMPKTPRAVIAIFGVMKAGAAYVPLDPRSPGNRWVYILENCACRFLICAAACYERLIAAGWLPSDRCAVIICDPGPGAMNADDEWLHSWSAALATRPEPLRHRTTENSPAYILYTSGSTGNPKGVLISHRACMSFVQWSVATFALNPSDRVSSHAPLHFDLSTFDIFASLAAGATVVMVPQRVEPYPLHFARFLAHEQISVTYLVPSALIRLITSGDLGAGDLGALRSVLFAGEVFPLKFLCKLVELLPRPRYFNLYGPTETNVCTCHEVTTSDLASEHGQDLPIGVALQSMRAFAVDEAGALIRRPGDTGELYVGGPQVALGYWGDSATTARSFIAHPFEPEYLERVYRTGDLVRLAEDGRTWHFLGRRDHMVKTRGYRVELAEIESCLNAHPLIELAIVVADPDEHVGTTLRAILTIKAGSSIPERAGLRAHCLRTLPAYMIPERYEFRDSLPLTSSGKIDRTALARAVDPPNLARSSA